MGEGCSSFLGGEALELVAGVANDLDLSSSSSEVALALAWGHLALEDMTAARNKVCVRVHT